MEPDKFIAEFYRRGALRGRKGANVLEEEDFRAQALGKRESALYKSLLPQDRAIRIVDIGPGRGQFAAICLAEGYKDLTLVDFTAREKFARISAVKTENLDGSIAQHFRAGKTRYDLIHMAHVIEHIPKYGLFDAVDALYASLTPGGILLLRTPNMESPAALSSLFCTLSHEYGFAGGNLRLLLHVCGFDDIRFHDPSKFREPGLRGLLGAVARRPFIAYQRLKHRLFGVNHGGMFGAELVVTARRGDHPGFVGG